MEEEVFWMVFRRSDGKLAMVPVESWIESGPDVIGIGTTESWAVDRMTAAGLEEGVDVYPPDL